MKYFNDDTITHFQFESNYVSKKEIQKQQTIYYIIAKTESEALVNPYLSQFKDKNVEVILVSLDFPRQYDSKLKPFIADRKLKSKVVALNDVNTNYWIPKVNEDWTGAIPATLIYNKDMRQFYEQSFTYEELETQLKQFLK